MFGIIFKKWFKSIKFGIIKNMPGKCLEIADTTHYTLCCKSTWLVEVQIIGIYMGRRGEAETMRNCWVKYKIFQESYILEALDWCHSGIKLTMLRCLEHENGIVWPDTGK